MRNFLFKYSRLLDILVLLSTSGMAVMFLRDSFAGRVTIVALILSFVISFLKEGDVVFGLTQYVRGAMLKKGDAVKFAYNNKGVIEELEGEVLYVLSPEEITNVRERTVEEDSDRLFCLVANFKMVKVKDNFYSCQYFVPIFNVKGICKGENRE